MSMPHVDENMIPVCQQIIEIIQSKLIENKQFILGIVGPPGVGKSTISSRLFEMLENSVIVPMDGFHYTKEELKKFDDPDLALRRRGSYWTFDGPRFVKSIEELRIHGVGTFPSFDHEIGDPIENDIKVKSLHRIVIVEGNYLLLKQDPWIRLKDCFDYSIYIDTDQNTLRNRVIRRHVKVGCSPEQAVERFETNDLLNAIEIDKSKNRADLIVYSI